MDSLTPINVRSLLATIHDKDTEICIINDNTKSEIDYDDLTEDYTLWYVCDLHVDVVNEKPLLTIYICKTIDAIVVDIPNPFK